MEKQINWGLKLSLEQMALRRVVANVLMESDSLALIQKCQFDPYSNSLQNKWKKFVNVENIVKVKIAKMRLPESLKKQMIYLIKPMGIDILKWKTYHEQLLENSSLKRHILKRLCWTCTGVINYQNTAKKLLRSKVFCTERSYKLACLYCLVDDIKILWEIIPNSIETNFQIELLFKLQFTGMNDKYVILKFMTEYWYFLRNGADSRLNQISESKFQCSFYQHAFTVVARGGNKAATEYFFQKLTQEEQDFALFRTVCRILNENSANGRFFPDAPSGENFTHVISYLFSLMNSTQQMIVFKKYPLIILKTFLNWPWQDVFLEIADVILTILPQRDYHKLFFIDENLRAMVNYFPNFFCEFFLCCPSDVRKHQLHQFKPFFFEIFKAEDTDSIKGIFRSIDIEDRVRILSSSGCFMWFDQLLMTEKWHLIQLCIQEATMSKEELERLKADLIGRKRHFYSGELTEREVRLRKRKWVNFFQFLDAANVNSLNKRGYEGDMNKTKKLCYLGKE